MSNEKDISDLMTKTLPQALKIMRMTTYSEESAKQIASAAIVFYNHLKKKGIPPNFAERLTEAYIGALKLPLRGSE